MHQYCSLYACVCVSVCISIRVTILAPLFFAFLFYDNIWPYYVYAAWAAGNENAKTGNNKVSDKSFPTVSVSPLCMYVCE